MMNFIRDGRIHAYFRGIFQSIYTIKNKCNKQDISPEYAAIKNALKNTIAQATNGCFSSRYTFGIGTTTNRQVPDGQSPKIRARAEGESPDGFASSLFPINFAPSSRSLRMGYEWATRWLRREWGKTRSHLEADLRGGRTRLEQRAKKGRRNAVKHQVDVLKQCLAATRSISAFNQIRTLFYRKPSLFRFCTVFFPSLTREMDGAGTLQLRCRDRKVQNKVRTRLKQSTNQIQIGFLYFLLILMQKIVFKLAKSVPLVYGLFTGSVPMLYRECTEKLLRRYQRATKASSLAVDLQSERRPAWEHRCSCISQACVVHMLSNGQAWIVRKTVPVDTLLTHYQHSIYASSILDRCLKSALSQISAFKRSNLFYQASEWFWINNPSNRLKCFLNKKLGAIQDVLKTCRKDFLLKSKFSVSMIALLVMTFAAGTSQAQTKPSYTLQGTVSSAVDKKPLQAVSVRVEADQVKTSTNKDGTFSVAVSQRIGRVKLTSVGYKTVELDYTAGAPLHVQLTPFENQLDEVEVVSTGYQKIPKERATGSFEVINKQQLNLSKSTNIINRLEGLSPSLRFDKRVEGLSPIEQLSVRTTSTYFGYNSPLVILDNFPYEGDISNINPNDIEAVTILKDAAAASIWGTRAGNGVIVLTSKKSDKDGKMKLSVQMANQIGEKPDLYKKPYMSSSSFMEMEELLFDQKFYDWQINAPDRVVSPLVLLLDQLRRGDIDSEMYEKQKNDWSKNDVRKDYLKYIYRNSYNQQYAANVLGGSSKFDFQASIGHDKNKNTLQKSSLERTTARLVSNIRPHKDLEINMQLMYGNSTTKGLGTDSQISFGSLYSGAGRSYYPYLRLVDDEGNAIDLETVTIRKSYIDTLASGRLLPAHYNIFNEFESSEKKNTTEDITLNIGANWKITSFLSGSVAYQFQKSNNKITNWQGADSYFTQHYTNMFTQWTPTTLTRNVPLGDILNQQLGIIKSHYLRGSFVLDKSFAAGLHKINAIAGAELKDLNNRSDAHNLYGYDRNTLSYGRVNYLANFPLLNGIMGSGQVIDGVKFDDLNQRFTSFFSNASYTFKDRYFMSGSMRRDASNLFGVASNNKWQPLWSLGLAWDITKEQFYRVDFLEKLKIRATYGYNGNANNAYSANPIMEYSGTNSVTSYTYAYMVNPSNPNYRAEKVGVLNVGVDFSLKGNQVSGSLDYYEKDGRDIVARGMLDPTTGFESQILNIAHFGGKGVEANIQTRNLQTGKFSWFSNFIFNYQRNITKKYNYRFSRADGYVDAALKPNPVEGRDLYGLYAYPFAGLDPNTGEAIGWLNGEESKEYAKIAAAPLESLKFMGSTVPLYSGFIRNTFNYGPFSLTANVQFKFKFVMRRPSINYTALANYWTINEDFDRRWKKPGDEVLTDVPAFIYPLSNARDNFYSFSDVLVERGDAVRIKDLNLQYSLKQLGKGKFNGSLFFNADNLNLMLWKKTKYNIDSDFYQGVPFPRVYTLGFNLNL